MLNIISRALVMNEINGPQKVAKNLIKGLDLLGYPYCVNKALNSTSQLWIHDDPIALKEASKMKLKAIVGPNIYINPRNIPTDIDLSRFVYIHPSDAVVRGWKHFGFNRCPLDSWPVGIDTYEFKERDKPKDGKVLIYFKQRYPEELDYIKKILVENKIGYEIILYGFYKQEEYLKKLNNTKYVIWIGRQESQGIALEEALSMNIPILVWDILKAGHWAPNKREIDILNKKESDYPYLTSAYYFNEQCGILIKDRKEIENSIIKMEQEWSKFEPRKYILNNLGLEKQAKDLIKLFDKYYNITYEAGKYEISVPKKKWLNDKLYFKAYILLKNKIKICLKLLKLN